MNESIGFDKLIAASAYPRVALAGGGMIEPTNAARVRRWWKRVTRRRCRAVSPEGERCKYDLGHDSTGQPHSWTRFGFGGFGGR